jgi:ferredoxin
MENLRSLYIYYFSGTGNARISSQWIQEEAEKRGIKTILQRIDRLENIVLPAPDDNMVIGFAFPTHGFNTAPLMLKFIAGFPSDLCKKVFLLNTRAGMKLYKIFMPGLTGAALLLPAFLLRLKGYKCLGFRPVDLPSNWISLHPGLKGKVIESIFIRCEKIVRSFANKIFDGEKIYRGLFSLPVDLILIPLALGYYLGGRYFLAKTFMANYNCDNCGLCIRECPTSSIKYVNNRPYWKLTCESCMRCLNRCPRRAIETAHGMAVLFWLIFTFINTQLILTMATALNIQAQSWWWTAVYTITGIMVLIGVIAVMYRIVHCIMKFKPVSYLVRFTSLTAFPFWRRYKYNNNN